MADSNPSTSTSNTRKRGGGGGGGRAGGKNKGRLSSKTTTTFEHFHNKSHQGRKSGEEQVKGGQQHRGPTVTLSSPPTWSKIPPVSQTPAPVGQQILHKLQFGTVGGGGGDQKNTNVSKMSGSPVQKATSSNNGLNGLLTEAPGMQKNLTLSALNNYRVAIDADVEKQGKILEAIKLSAEPKPTTWNLSKVPPNIRLQAESLPIFAMKEKIIKAVEDNQMVIIVGATGSGKSTQIPKYLAQAGFAASGKIGITEPRRVAAKSLAERVSVEGGVDIGTLVGYAVRFDKCISGETIIKYMTDGTLVRDFSIEPNLESYSVIMVDEAHERSISTDVCFGLLKQAARNRPNLKIIITSATLESTKFSKYFNNAEIINIPGTSFPIEEIYEPKSESDYIQGVVDLLFKIHKNEKPGDVLVFLTGQDDIEFVWDLFENGMSARRIGADEVLIMPCHGSLPLEEQNDILKPAPAGVRKIVLATNIAETTLTIDGIVYVVDCGLVKQKEYNPKSGIESLTRIPITKAQATQRMGRAGRTQPGKCYRLYSKYQYMNLKSEGVPEIKRTNVENVVLQLVSLGVKDILKFDFMDSPNLDQIMEAMEHLVDLGALDEYMGLTMLGRKMSEFPLDPPLAKVLITSSQYHCAEEVLTIVSLLSTQHQNLFVGSKKLRVQANEKKAQFSQPEGDHLTLLKVFNCWRLNDYSKEWCRNNYIQYRILTEAEEIRTQLSDMMTHQGFSILSCRTDTIKIRKSFCSGFFRRLAKAQPRVKGGYMTFTNETSVLIPQLVYVHPASALFPRSSTPPWVIYHEVVKTKKAYMRGNVIIEPSWVKECAPKFVQRMARKYSQIAEI